MTSDYYLFLIFAYVKLIVAVSYKTSSWNRKICGGQGSPRFLRVVRASYESLSLLCKQIVVKEAGKDRHVVDETCLWWSMKRRGKIVLVSYS